MFLRPTCRSRVRKGLKTHRKCRVSYLHCDSIELSCCRSLQFRVSSTPAYRFFKQVLSLEDDTSHRPNYLPGLLFVSGEMPLCDAHHSV